mmetsp:Transcript_27681/g.42925  ORF Transcript_27681/g.42925 Transcript_27681/m.42925 type:complete len:250 (+) Transcript_27681:623-1372(+)
MNEEENSSEDAHTEENPIFAGHLGQNRPYWRDIVLGVNDGLVSTFLLVAGVSGAGLSISDTLLTGISGALAGAISMAAGEYLATKSQDEVSQGELTLEQEHIREHHEDEVREVRALLHNIGIDESDLRDQLIKYYEENDDALMKIMMALEFGVVTSERRSSIKAALFSCGTFLIGALPSVLPFAFVKSVSIGLIVSGGLTGLGLALVGWIKSFATRGNPIRAASENMLIGGLGGVLAYVVGEFFNLLIN